MTKRVFFAVLSAALLVVTTVSPAFATAGHSVRGGGSGILPPPFFAGDRFFIELTANELPNGTAQGRFHLQHTSASGGLVGEVSGNVECIDISGSTATVSGVITSGHLSESPGFDPSGETAAITIVDDGAGDSFGFDLSFFPQPHSIAPCQATSPFVTVDQGNYSVR